MAQHGARAVGTSEAEEMYLITAARAIEGGATAPVPVSRLTEDLAVSTVSANQMIKKLAQRGLLEYTPYRGVTLTEDGWGIAHATLRRRRLWGVFLSDRLGLAPGRADDVACDMEHITPDDVTDRLAVYLGHPTTGPTGRPIPAVSGARPEGGMPLGEAPLGDSVHIDAVHATAEGAAFLRQHGLEAGAAIEIVAMAEDGSMLVEGGAGQVRLAPSAAAWIRVRTGA